MKESKWELKSINMYNANGEKSGETLTPVEVHIPRDYLNEKPVQYDYALITVEEDLWDRLHFSLGVSYNVTSAAFASVPIYVTGVQSGRLETGQGKLNPSNGPSSEGNALRYDVDTDSGQSGSPVYTIIRNEINGNVTYTYSALAIHNSGVGAGDRLSNQGPRITKYQLQFFSENNTYAHWE